LFVSIKLDPTLMKYLFTLIVSFLCFNAFSQYSIYETFENPNDGYRANFYIDTVSCSHNIWQIGKPQKPIFYYAASAPNVIITDTLNPYPPNDTSIFYLSTVGTYHGLLSLFFYYFLDIDSLTTATIEISGDRGLNWINPMTEDTTYLFYWVGGKPNFDISTGIFHKFELNMDTWSRSYPGSPDAFPHYRTSDTITYRFTFISGDTTYGRDGWMMDNFIGENTARVGIDDVNKISSNIFPNPTSGTIYLHPNFTSTPADRLVVYNITGQQVYSTVPTTGLPITLPLRDGVYTVKYFGALGVATDRVVILR
jgi:hypothetical protein